MNKVLLWSLVILLVLTGIGQPLLIQEINYAGAGGKFTMLYMIPNYIGMILMLLLPPTMLSPPRDAEDALNAKANAHDRSKSASDDSEDNEASVSVTVPPAESTSGAASEGTPLLADPGVKDQDNGRNGISRLCSVTQWPRTAKILLISTLDVFSFSGCFLGMMFCGSMIYTVIYASVTTNTAILARIFLKRKLSWMQWGGCVVVTGGLAVSAVGNVEYGPQVALGALIVLFGTIMHSFMYVANEAVMQRGEDRLPPIRLCGLVGIFGTVVMGIWQGIWTIPNWQSEVVDPLLKAGTSITIVIVLYVSVMIVDAAHDGIFYVLLGSLGSVTTGVLKGATAISVFVGSSVAFCHKDKSQCFTLMKGISLILVVGGVLLYSWATQRSEKKRAQLHDRNKNVNVDGRDIRE